MTLTPAFLHSVRRRRIAFNGVNNIGTPARAGFGAGICPSPPVGFAPMQDHVNPLSANYGNYQYSDGSVMVWIPAFYLRLAHANNPTYGAYGVNSVDIKGLAAYASEAAANADGYYLHRAFVNGGVNQLGFFRDKYDCSQNGTIASSIAGVQPMVSSPVAGQVGFAGCTANGQAPVNSHRGAIDAARSRGNAFFPETIFMADALARISEAHAQAATSTTWCAWYDGAGVMNFPKGNNSNTLKDSNDAGVTFTSAGNATYPNFSLAGSGAPFAKTTHNGQACGVTDVAGNIYKITPGMTSIAATKAITGATQANPVALTIAGHGYATGRVAVITNVGGMAQINNRMYTLTVVDADHVTLDGVDGTAYTAFTAGGWCTTGSFYLLKPTVDIASITSGGALATDHWGATGVAAMFDAVVPNFATGAANNAMAQRYGNGANQVFGWGTAAARSLSMAGLPAAGGVSAGGSNLMGLDHFYQNIADQLCVLSRGYWASGLPAGVRFRALTNARTDANYFTGFAASRYL